MGRIICPNGLEDNNEYLILNYVLKISAGRLMICEGIPLPTRNSHTLFENESTHLVIKNTKITAIIIQQMILVSPK